MPREFKARFSISDQAGKATTLAMLACVAAMTFYLRVGRSFVMQEFGDMHATTCLVILSLISIFTIGCVIHMMVLGEMSLREFRRELEREAQASTKFAAEVAKELEVYERQCCIYNGSLSNVTIRALGTTRRISMALTERAQAVEQLIAKRSSSAWLEAGELLRSPLRTDGDCCRSLIVGDPIAPIEADELVPLLKALFSDIEYGITRSASFEPRFSQDSFGDLSGLSEEEPVRQRRPTVH